MTESVLELERTPEAAARASMVDDRIAYYNDLFAGRFGESTRAMMDEAIERHDILFKVRHAGRILRPLIVHESTYRRVSAAVRRLARAIELAVDRLAADADLRRTVRIPEYLEPLIAIDGASGSHSLYARFDGFISASGRFTMIEFNSAPGGAHVAVEMNRAFGRLPIARAFARRYPVRWRNVLDRAHDTLVRDHRDHGGRGTPTVGVVRVDHDIVTLAGARWLTHVATRGCRVMSAPLDEFRYEHGRLTVDDVAIDLLLF